MKYLKIKEIANKWNISERSVRNYCNQGRVIGAYIDGKTWFVPEDAKKPTRLIKHDLNNRNLLSVLQEEKEARLSGGIYHKLQIEMTYNSNHIEGSKLTHEQTRLIFETRTIGIDSAVNVDDIIETSNHFRCIDYVIDLAKVKLTESFIKQLHFILKNGTNDSTRSWFKVGDYKILENEVGGMATTKPENVKEEIVNLFKSYNSLEHVAIEDIIEFHKKFEAIHPFQDGNGRIGRLLMLKECLKHNLVPIIITADLKQYYYRGLKEWDYDNKYLIDTCLSGQDIIKEYLDYFKIDY